MEQIRDTSARVLSPLRCCCLTGFGDWESLHLADKHPSFNVALSTYTLTPKYRRGFEILFWMRGELAPRTLESVVFLEDLDRSSDWKRLHAIPTAADNCGSTKK